MLNKSAIQDGLLPSRNPVLIVCVNRLPVGIGKLHDVSDHKATIGIQLPKLADTAHVELEVVSSNGLETRRIRLPVKVVSQNEGTLHVRADRQWRGVIATAVDTSKKRHRKQCGQSKAFW